MLTCSYKKLSTTVCLTLFPSFFFLLSSACLICERVASSADQAPLDFVCVMHPHAWMQAHTHTRTNTHIKKKRGEAQGERESVCVWKRVCARTLSYDMHIYVYMYVYMYTHTYIYIHIYRYININVYMYVSSIIWHFIPVTHWYVWVQERQTIQEYMSHS